MKPGATAAEIGAVIRKAESMGAKTHPIYGDNRTVVALVGDLTRVNRDLFDAMEGVLHTLRIQEPYKLSSRTARPDDTVIELPGTQVRIGGSEIVVMAGPCSVESREQTVEIALAVKAAGATVLRGGAFKPRTSPYSFQGHKEDGLKMLAAARDATGLAIVTEVMAPEQVSLVAKYADVLQIGARNMQNYNLLQAAGDARMPVLLKRGMSSTMEEFLLAAEYILDRGNPDVILCERGIRTFEDHTRFTLPLSVVPFLHDKSHLPVMVDPSHGTGKSRLVAPMAKAAIACGADGLMIEVHDDPEHALSDGAQTITPAIFERMMADCARIAAAVDRTI
jgi:3-deoxy-7-phosphoheptulonate synthase